MTKSKKETFNAYQGTEDYVASEALQEVVNVALAIKRPLLLKGEPGTGKTLLAQSIAKAIGRPLLRWNIKSTTKAVEGLYVYDTVQRLNDSRFGGGNVSDIKHYIKLGKLGESFVAPEPVVLLIDEIDKADLEFPNDLLAEIDEMRFYIPETREEISAKHRPMVVITSNSEKELPDAFLRRCVFHFIEFPNLEMMEQIVKVHFPTIEKKMLEASLKKFYEIRTRTGLKKPPSTSELIDWLHALIAMGLDPKSLDETPLIGCLLKNEQDINTKKSTYRYQ
ncbi:MAG: MoxR family ATPase [Deltaproteobacteria bacterium]|nr:MAG: MoxR family ATPase [Deltaproteobacteria bacterium]